MDGNGDVRIAGLNIPSQIVGRYDLGQPFHVSMVVDLSSRIWRVEIDDQPLAEAVYSGPDVDRIRIDLQNLAGRDSNLVAVDDIVLRSIVPEPHTSWLVLCGLLALLPFPRATRRSGRPDGPPSH